MGDELNDKSRAMAKYRRHSILLLVPLFVPILALAEERRKSSRLEGHATAGRRRFPGAGRTAGVVTWNTYDV